MQASSGRLDAVGMYHASLSETSKAIFPPHLTSGVSC